MESLECLGTLEDKVKRVLLALLDSLEQMVKKEQGEQLANQALEGNADQQVHVGDAEREDQQESQVQRAPQAVMDLQAHLESGDLKDLRDLSVYPGPKDRMGHLEKMGCQVILDRGEKRVSKERLDLPDLEEWWDHRDQLEGQDQSESEDTQAPLVHPENQVCLGLQEKRGERVIQVLQVILARWDHLD